MKFGFWIRFRCITYKVWFGWGVCTFGFVSRVFRRFRVIGEFFRFIIVGNGNVFEIFYIIVVFIFEVRV